MKGPLLFLFGLAVGAAAGFYLSSLTQATSQQYLLAQLEAHAWNLTYCDAERKQLTAVIDVQQDVLLRQAELLSTVEPLVIRAFPRWPWGRPEETHER